MISSAGTAISAPRRWSRLLASRWVHWLLLAGVVAWFMRGWWNGHLPATPRMEMIVQFATAWMIRQDWQSGRFLSPWNSLELGGFPWTRLLAVPVYMGVAALSLVPGLTLESSLKILAFVGFAASGITLYEYARVVTGRWEAALVAGVVYAVLPYHLHTAVDWWEFIPFWALLPLPFLFYERALRSGRRRSLHLGLAALCLGLFMSASRERAIVSALWFGAYAVLREVVSVARKETTVGHAVGRLAVVAAVAAGLSAYAAVPAALELKQLGASHMRGPGAALSADALQNYSASPQLMAAALLRRLRLPVDTSALPSIWASFGGMHAWYLGWTVLGLVALGLLQARRTWFVLAAVLFGGAALLMSFGPTVPFNPFQRLPFLQSLIPFRGLMLVALFGSVLAGLGVVTLGDWLRRVPTAAWTGLALVAIVVDLGPASQAFLSVDRYFSPDEEAAYRWLAQQGGDGRLWEPSDLLRPRYTRSYSLPLAPVPRYSGHWVEGTPIRAWEMMDWGDQQASVQLLGVRYAAVRTGEPRYSEWLARVRGYGFAEEAWRSPEMVILEDPTAKPFATLRAPALLAVDGDLALLKEMPTLLDNDVPVVCMSVTEARESLEASSAFPVWLADKVDADALLVPGGSARAPRIVSARDLAELPAGTAVRGRLQTTWESPTRIRVEAAPESLALLTVRENWYPNWRVAVDGKPTQLLRVDYSLMGVLLEAEDHVVSFEYRTPWYDWVSLGITAATLVAWVAWQIVAARSRRASAHA